MALPYNPVISLGKEAYVSCPFNKEHKMSESSLQKHVLRCMVNYPEYIACPYNALHYFRNNEILEKHISECPCKPFPYEGKENTELIHECGNLYDAKYWAEIVENWDK